MPDLNSLNQWIWNCDKDLDVRAIWGDNGTINIQRNLLRGINYTVRYWNPIDGWREKSHNQMLPSPTSQPHTFNNVVAIDSFAKGTAPQYWGKPFTIKGILVIIHGDPNGEEVVTTVQGCYTRNDPYYHDEYGCTPPDVKCQGLRKET